MNQLLAALKKTAQKVFRPVYVPSSESSEYIIGSVENGRLSFSATPRVHNFYDGATAEAVRLAEKELENNPRSTKQFVVFYMCGITSLPTPDVESRLK